MLALLALNANRMTPIDQLIDAVWDTAPPTTARAQIHICVSALRKLFAEAGALATIKTRKPGYLLEILPSELDTEQFAALVTTARTHAGAGRNSEAVATLRGALALWQGPALAGVRSDLVRRGAVQLEGARLAAVIERVRLDLALGRHEEVVGELAALVEEHPLRERLCEFLMLALYRSGRQAEALEVCRHARAMLVEELGIEPGQSVQRLERAILNRDPELEFVSTVVVPLAGGPASIAEHQAIPRRLPASIADFTGRDRQLVEIKQLLTDETGPHPPRYGMRIVAISGKGGVGKSTLAIRAAHEVREEFADGHLYVDLEAPNGDGRVGSVLARFLRALGVDGSAVPENLDERAEMYRSRLASKRVLVVLDGATSEDQVLPLLPAGSGCAVIVTSRARLSGLPGAHLVDVEVFDVDLALEMLGRIVGAERVRAEHDSAVELINFCGGLPLALRIAGARLASRPHWRLDILVARLRNTAGRLDELAHHGLELRSNIGLTYHGLSVNSKRLFRLFALITTSDFPQWTAAALLDIDSFDADEVLENLVEAQLLDTVNYPGENLRFRLHDLIRVYAQEQLLAAETELDRKSALSRLLGACLARAELAHRKEYGGDYTILHGSAARWLPANGVVGIDDPMEWLEAERRALVSAVHLAAEAGLDELCWDLALTCMTLFEMKGYFDDWRETTEQALEATTLARNERGQAAMNYSLGTMYMYQKRLFEAERCFDTAIALFSATSDVHGCALVLRNAAAVDRMRGRSAAMLAKYDEALDKMREVGDLIGEEHILRRLAKFWTDEGDIDRARDLLDRALVCCQRVGYLRGEAQVVNGFAELYLGSGQVEQAHQALNRVLLIVRDIGDRIGEAHALYGLGVVRQRTGRLDNAEATLQHALSLTRRVGERLVEGQALYALGEIELARGNAAAGEVHLGKAQQLFDELGSIVWQAKALILLSDVHHGRGDIPLVSRDVEEAIRLLGTADSKEAGRLRVELETTRSALLTNGSVGGSADSRVN